MKDLVHSVSQEVSKIWNGWEIRGSILLSLTIQVILIFFGSQRKYRKRVWTRMIVWSSYMVADWVATFALGNLAKIQLKDRGDTISNKKYILQAFWAPFVLLHLGGPDTITAYSLEDNELWLRHFLALFVEAAVSAYVVVRSWTGTYLSYFSIPILVIGFIKYGERTYVLWSASTKKFKDDLLASMKRRTSSSETENYENCLIEARSLFKRFQYLFANLILNKKDWKYCYDIIVRQKTAEEAFKVVAIELGFLYDVLYTKATLLYFKVGIVLRCTIFVASVTGLIVFSFFMDVHGYHDTTDVIVTYLLLGGAACLEVLAFFNFLRSDWTMLRLVKLRKLDVPSCVINQKRWSGYMGQYNLLEFCLKESEGIFRYCVKKLPSFVGKMLEEFLNLQRQKVTKEVLNAIYEQLKAKGEKLMKKLHKENAKEINNYTLRSRKDLLNWRGEGVLQEKDEKTEGDGMFQEKDNKREGDGKIEKEDDKNEGDRELKKEDLEKDKFHWCTVDIEFDHSLLVWHIATDVLYHAQLDPEPDSVTEHAVSKYLSDYMLYLLVVCPSMLPQGIGEIRYRDTCAQVTRFYKRLPEKEKPTPKDKSAFRKLLYDRIGRRPANQSVLSDGCKLAHQLKDIKFEDRWTIIREVWIEMLAYVASHCRWKEHAQQLWKGGELLTHVCVLMANLGLSEQYVLDTDSNLP